MSKLSHVRSRHLYAIDKAGTVLEITNDGETHADVNYASVTAPAPCYVEVRIGDDLFDAVHIAPGGSHSWWTPAGGKLLDHNGLEPGQKLEITSTGACAFRIDWI